MELRASLDTEKKAYEEIRHDHQALDDYTKGLRAKSKALDLENKSLTKRNQELKSENEDLDLNNKHFIPLYKAGKTENGDLKERVKFLEDENRTQMGKIEALEKENGLLKTEILKAEDESQLKEPLFLAGLHIRLRFLENARVYLFRDKDGPIGMRRRFDPTIIKQGNEVAHAGLGSGDVVIFQAGWVVDEQQRRLLEETFEQLYYTTPSNYSSIPSKMKEATDLQVTIRTLTALNTRLDRPIRERQTALEHYDYIKNRYEKVDVETFQVDLEVERRLGQLKALTDNIVKADRSTRPQLSPAKPTTSYSSATDVSDDYKPSW